MRHELRKTVKRGVWRVYVDDVYIDTVKGKRAALKRAKDTIADFESRGVEARVTSPKVLTVCRFHIPFTGNEEALRALDVELCKVFGGLTVWGGHGQWQDDKELVYKEGVYIYEIACENPAAVRLIATEFARTIGEKALYFVVGSQAEIISL